MTNISGKFATYHYMLMYLFNKKMKKKLLLFVFSAFVTLSAWCQKEYSTLVVELNDGSRVDYVLSQKPTISMVNNAVCITTGDNGMEVTYPSIEVKRLNLEVYDPAKDIETP